MDLKEKQRESLRTMLSFGKPIDPNSHNTEPVWKVLVYDTYGQDIISPLLKIGELRALGVTLHVRLEANREIIPDTPAIYFVMPTKENVERICRDCKEGLYENVYLNFISSIPRSLLDLLATLSVESQCVPIISKIYDQYLNFISLERDVFQLRIRERDSISYKNLNNPGAVESEVKASIAEIVSSLFSVLVTSGIVPIIRCPRGNAAEMIARELDAKLRDHLKGRNNLFANSFTSYGTYQRPILILLDRNQDLATMLRHSWTYQALVHDVLDMESNRVTVTPHDPKGTKNFAPQSYALDSGIDTFWNEIKYSPFQDVLVKNDEEVKKYSESENAAVQGINTTDMQQLTNAVSQVTVLRDKKTLIEMHTNILWTLTNTINDRNINLHFENEQKCVNNEAQEKSLPVYLSETKGTANDLLRVYLIHVLSDNKITDDEKQQCEEYLGSIGANLACLQYVKQFKQYNKMAGQLGGGANNAAAGSMFERMTNKIVNHGTDILSKGIQNVFPSSNKFPLTRIVDELMENRMGAAEEYEYFDPKIIQKGSTARTKSQFAQGIVFVVGGGNMAELHNLQEYSQSCTPQKNIVYGASELVTGEAFLNQLNSLGR